MVAQLPLTNQRQIKDHDRKLWERDEVWAMLLGGPYKICSCTRPLK
jgi:hypothetical protein